MRILVVTPVYPPYKGGMGAVAAQEVKLVREAGYGVSIITPQYSDKPVPVDEDVTCLDPVFAWGNAAVLPWKFLWDAIQTCDVVHLHYPFFGTALPVVLMANIAKKHLVVTWHMRAHAERGAWMRKTLFFLHRMCEEPLIKRFAQRMCVSSADYAEILRLPAKKVITVPFGVDDRRFLPQRNEQLRAEHGIAHEDCIFLFVGGMDRAHAFKGVSLLLHAFAKMKDRSHSKLWLVGSGELQTVYVSLAKELGIEKQVLFWGGVPFEDLPSIYQAADVHVLPSVSGAEAYGLVTCEAGASGIPSIVSALPGVRSLVQPEKTGLHVEPGNVTELTAALTRLAENKEERKAFGEQAYRNITKNYTLQVEQSALLRAYTEQGNVNE